MQNYTSDSKLKAALSYIIVLNLIFYITERNNHFVRYHCAQSIVLYVLLILVRVVMGILGIIPLLGWLFGIISWVFTVIWLVLAVACAFRAARGELSKLPFVEIFADKIAR